MNYRITLYAILIITTIFYGCSSNPLDVNLSERRLNIAYTNVDKMLYKQSISDLEINVKVLKKKLGELFLFELSQNIRQNINDSSYQTIYNFYNSEYISKIEEEKQKLYSGLRSHEERLNKAFRYIDYHFSDSLLPQNIFYINKLFSQVTCEQSNIAVGLENYTSPKSDVISSIPNSKLYQWQRDRMNIDFLERDILLNWIQVQLFEELDGKLAEHIIQAGKILYILNAAFPKVEEAYVLRYNSKQYEWAINNENSVWNYLVGQQLLFKTDIRIRTNFLNEGPTTVGLSDDSPDRIGQFLGYRIVKGYMNKNKTLPLLELIETKYNTILQTYEIE